MAFISGYNRRYECKICGIRLIEKVIPYDNDLHIYQNIVKGFEYSHPIDGFIMINGYPSACKNNGIDLIKKEIRSIDVPIIESNYRTMSY